MLLAFNADGGRKLQLWEMNIFALFALRLWFFALRTENKQLLVVCSKCAKLVGNTVSETAAQTADCSQKLQRQSQIGGHL